MPREQTFYPDDSTNSPFEPYHGVLFRYDEPEFFTIEVNDVNTFMEFSTDKSIEDAAAAYESIYGKRVRAQEVLNPDGELDDVDQESVIRIGPNTFLLVALKAYRYAWVEPHRKFVDRETKTPTVVINDIQKGYDERNSLIVAELASPAVKADLGYTLDFIHSMRE